ncbi:MAG: ABC transporter substrate-binding protein [Anaerolineae bacterium]|nr:ABC transporter substrate-binding protein [Anaerolineae bacterium]
MAVMVLALAACRPTPAAQQVVLMLDWVPNTNHTGIYVALDKGWYREQGIELEIIQPAEAGVEQVVGAGQAQFGISFAEWLTAARVEGIPIVSLAAIIQHNTSGFASPAEKGLERPRDLEGHRYGGGGLEIERAMLRALMECDGADVDRVEFVDVGYADFFVVTQREVDFTWIYYAWTGIEAEIRQVPINVIWLRDYVECVPDYYTPIIITSEALIAEEPDLVRRFMAATARGYQYAIEDPEGAAEILLAHAEADEELVRRSQEWLSPRYAEDAPRWGEQDLAVWQRFTDWMYENGLIAQPIEAEAAFTNDFLPQE